MTMTAPPREPLLDAMRRAINCHSAESASNTPDYILAQFLGACLAAFNTATQQRETWYGRDARPSLAAPAPSAEPRHLTRDEQEMLTQALHASAKRVEPQTQSPPMPNTGTHFEPPARAATDAGIANDFASLECVLQDANEAALDKDALIEQQARELVRMRVVLQNIVDCYEFRSEFYTNDADCAGNLYDKARKCSVSFL